MEHGPDNHTTTGNGSRHVFWAYGRGSVTKTQTKNHDIDEMERMKGFSERISSKGIKLRKNIIYGILHIHVLTRAKIFDDYSIIIDQWQKNGKGERERA